MSERCEQPDGQDHRVSTQEQETHGCIDVGVLLHAMLVQSSATLVDFELKFKKWSDLIVFVELALELSCNSY